MNIQNINIPVQRDWSIDALKGFAMILMILGHCTIGVNDFLTNLIFSFHMPLFFIVIGFFQKGNKGFKETIQSNYRRVIIPFFLTSALLAIFFFVKEGTSGLIKWLFSMVLANGSGSVLGMDGYHIGPLWFLIAFFFGQIFLFITFAIKTTQYQISFIAVLLGLSFIIKESVGLLPLSLLPAIGACVFTYLGKYFPFTFFKSKHKLLLLAGVIIWFICVYVGGLSMASHKYPLLIISFIGAYFGTLCVYQGILKLENCKNIYRFLVFCGQNSLLILCIHSVDYMTHISGLPYYLFLRNISDPSLIILARFVFKFSFVFFCYLLLYKIRIVKSVFKLHSYPQLM